MSSAGSPVGSPVGAVASGSLPVVGTPGVLDGSMTLPRRALRAVPAALLLLALAAGCGQEEPLPDVGPARPVPTTGAADPETMPTTPAAPTTTPSVDPTTTPTDPGDPTESTDPTDQPTEDPGGVGPTTYDEALARFDGLALEPTRPVRFTTRDTDIYCVLAPDYGLPVSCELGDGFVPAPAGVCDDAPTQFVGRIEQAPDGSFVPVCNSDTFREPGGPRVALGAAAVNADSGVGCLSESIGITCVVPETQRGFFLGSGEYHVF